MGSISVRLAGLAAAAGLLLAGCSDEPVPQEPDPTPTSAAPSPTLTPPVLPEEAKVSTMAGAANFSVHWMAVSDYAAASGDVEPLQAISGDGCTACKSYVDLYNDVYANGGSFSGGQHVLSDVSTRASPDGKTVLVRAVDTMAAGSMRRSAKSDPEVEQPSSHTITFRIEREGDHWMMAEFFADE